MAAVVPPRVGGDLPAGAAPVSRRVHDGGCRRSAKEIRTEWLPVSRNGARPAQAQRQPAGCAGRAVERHRLSTAAGS